MKHQTLCEKSFDEICTGMKTSILGFYSSDSIATAFLVSIDVS